MNHKRNISPFAKGYLNIPALVTPLSGHLETAIPE